MTQTPLRVGIAGFGLVGKLRRDVMEARGDMTVVAVCDRRFGDEGEAEGKLPCGTPFYSHYSRVLEHNLDALFVCISNDMAAEITRAGLEHGLHVFCEKPPGRDVADIQSVLDVQAKHPDLVLKYGFNHRYHDSVQDALELVRSGGLGSVINLRGIYGKSKIIDFRSPSHWRTKRELAGGGILLDQGIHMLDLMRLFGGEFEEVHSFISNAFWNHDVEDNAYALMRGTSGVVAMLHSSATQWRHRFQLEITLTEGTLVLSGILTGSKSYGAETLTVVTETDAGNGDPKETTTRYNRDESWQREIAEFADAIAGKSAVENGTAEDAYKTMELVYRIYCADPDWKSRWGLSS
ncbi:MAG: Gfo/Idh/MocA family protein [Magnetovibrionaceae bacterium]